MKNTYLVITSIASQEHPVLKEYASEALDQNIKFLVIGDTKSPTEFKIDGCAYYSVSDQIALKFHLSKLLPFKHYARKNIGYLLALAQGAEIIIETDDDNLPMGDFWAERELSINTRYTHSSGWTNAYKFFSDTNIWPRGFSLEHLQPSTEVKLFEKTPLICPIQQGLADENPDVDAIYRLTLPLPFNFEQRESVALGNGAICPFNSQNTTWFKEAFPLLYLPYYCNFRMTDIWRSFIAQRILWTCDWHLLFHSSTVRQERNDHNLMHDFTDEISGYLNNTQIMEELIRLELKPGPENITSNLRECYKMLISKKFVGEDEMPLLEAWIADLTDISAL